MSENAENPPGQPEGQENVEAPPAVEGQEEQNESAQPDQDQNQEGGSQNPSPDGDAPDGQVEEAKDEGDPNQEGATAPEGEVNDGQNEGNDGEPVDSGAQEAAAEAQSQKSSKSQRDGSKAASRHSGEDRKEDDINPSDDNRFLWMINQMEENLENFKNEMWKDEHYSWLRDFLEDPESRKIFFWVEAETDLRISTVQPPKFYDQGYEAGDFQVLYFLKIQNSLPITIHNIDKFLMTGVVDSDPLDDLLNKMNTQFLNKLLQERTWPEGVKKEFVAGLHKFMAALTEASHQSKGRTTLYIPQEDLSDPEAASKDKDLLQRLESTVIYWTRQIKEVVSNQDTQQSTDSSSPLDEIRHWNHRSANLNILYKQLQKPELKRIINVLHLAESSYLHSFRDLEKKIEEGSSEANDNLKFLNNLAEPSKRIEQSEPKDIPKILPGLLYCVRLTWELSSHYNTPERMKGLLTKISNQIIQRCRAKINKDDMLHGDVEKCMSDLDESIWCCNQWKEICLYQQNILMKHSPKGRDWTLNSDETIFAENEAFIQRCKDLKEICEGQLQFARKSSTITLPEFGGSKGPEIKKNLEELENLFKKNLKVIQDLDYDILDVKNTKWHDDYGQTFKEAIKNLEIMYQNSISIAFKSASTVQEAVEMLENFDQLAQRPLVKDYVHKKAAEWVYKFFSDEMKEVEEMFESQNKKPPPKPISHPKYAGVSLWADSLICRIRKSKSAIDTLFYIKDHPHKKEALEKYTKLMGALDTFITQTQFKLWEGEVAQYDKKNLEQKLSKTILVRSGDADSDLSPQLAQNHIFARSKQDNMKLESNFDKALLKIISEVTYWKKLESHGFVSVKHHLSEMNQNKEKLRVLRENVMLIVRDYNTIIESISDKRETELFHEHLRYLDKVIEPGFKKHNWSQTNDNFVFSCRKSCHEVFKRVKKFQKNREKMKGEFDKIASTNLTAIGKKLYHLKDFLIEQEKVLKSREEFFHESVKIIIKKMMSTYELFIEQGEDIQNKWLAFVSSLDSKLESSLKQTVKNTLVDLSKHIRGDQKADIVPLFKVYTVLDPTEGVGWKIIHEPSHAELRDGMVKFISQISGVTKSIVRIDKIFRSERDKRIDDMKKEEWEAEKNGGTSRFSKGGRGPQNMSGIANNNLTEEEKESRWVERWKLPKKYDEKPTYYDRISNKKAIIDKTKFILEGVDNIQSELEKDRKDWSVSEFRQLHNIRSDKGIRRLFMSKSDPYDPDPVQKYKLSIENIYEQRNDINRDNQPVTVEFILIDSSKLRQKLYNYGSDYINQLYNMLLEETKEDLNSLYKTFNDVIVELKSPSSDLTHLKKNLDLYDKIKSDLPALEGRIDPIKKKFAYLEEQQEIELNISEDDLNRLRQLPEAWKKFQDGLAEAHGIIVKSQGQLRAEVENQMEDFKRAVAENRKNWTSQAPWTVDKNTDTLRAKEKFTEYKQTCKDLREQEESNKKGLDIFNMDPMAYPDLSHVETEIDMLSNIWEVKEEWDQEWNKWKNDKFNEIIIEDMDDKAVYFQEKMKTFDREVRQWGVYEHLKNTIESFKHTIPLIMDLRDEAMRERHWKELRIEARFEQDENDGDFTLEKVFEIRLLEYAEFISELADKARKEMKIEVQLREIKRMWEKDSKSDLDIEKTKQKGNSEDVYKIRSAENIYNIIEDHGSKLSNMKSSLFYKQFEKKIDKWENNLAQVSETIEMLLSVQSKWSYLESIFTGQMDIQRQLVQETSTFEKINTIFKQEMERINKERNALRCLISKGFLPLLGDLNKKLEGIQKNLNQFLETKRLSFPRFFFLSNDDLLQIIGQSKDPRPVQQHIKKCFEGIQQLKLNEPGQRNKNWEISGMVSPEKETVQLVSPIIVENKVEEWFNKLLKGMREAIKGRFQHVSSNNSLQKMEQKNKIGGLIKENEGQILITYSQIIWTTSIKNALIAAESGQNNLTGLKKLKTSYKKKVDAFVDFVKNQISDLDRMKLIALITIEEHNREIIDRLYSMKITSEHHFEWQQQLRFKKEEASNESIKILVYQTNCVFEYGYEYQGNNGRLVVTPLTDRAYMTLTNALNMQRGGAPQGPAGTGKTETVKDLGKNLAFFVVIQNCSDSLDYIALGKMFSGLAQSGSWGCFDEFNRIEVEVLSVVSQQISTILDAIKRGDKSTPFADATIKIEKEVGIFITMNPGYAGRSELPDNLASLFRPVAMMVPDFVTIAKIILMSEGFKDNAELAKKTVTLYELMKKQLSKQDHYDFGMRAVKSVLTTSGRVKRQFSNLDEFTVMIKAIRDMNLPKFIAEDIVLFDNLFIDLFPGHEEPEYENDAMLIAIEDSMRKKNLQLNENLAIKIIQLFESQVTRHSNMMVGLTLSGKTKCWEILQDAMNILYTEEKAKLPSNKDPLTHEFKNPPVRIDTINPKSISINELYGYFEEGPQPQWHDGILSTTLKARCQDSKCELKWMVLDGPIDTLWIESMNSVMDDSKLLTLNNGDRIALSPYVRLLFEVENLAVASPATVSRAGMIFMDVDDLGWRPYVDIWIEKKTDEQMRELLEELFEKYVGKVLSIRRTQCHELIPTSEFSCVMNLCKLFDSMIKTIKKLDDEDIDAYNLLVEKQFVFCLIWSIGATVEEESRRDIDFILRDIESIFPHQNTVYDHYINTEKRDWAPWDDKLQANWKPQDKDAEFHKIYVPTVDTVRNRTLVQSLMDNGSQVLLVGHTGVGKTALVEGILTTLDFNIHSFNIQFSAGTTSSGCQDIIEANFEKRTKNKYRPKGGKKLAVCFIDDLNMPRKDLFGSQPPLELIRQWLDYGAWFHRTNLGLNYICDLQFLSAMGKPGGGRAEISRRLQSKFHIINFTIPNDIQTRRIFETLAAYKFQNFEEEIKGLSEPLAIATINLFSIIQENFLPIPSRSHYVFNMRDMSKVFQGMYRADRNFYESKEHIIKLWSHEILRIFHDRLISNEDREKFIGYLNEQIESNFQLNYAEHCQTEGLDAIYVDFLNDNVDQVYEEVTDFEKLRTYLITKLQEYNVTPKLIPMDLVLFKDAISHVCRIYRILQLKRGHACLVGVGGSGRHSLTRLSSYLAEMTVHQIEVSKGYDIKNFRDFLKELFEFSGFRGRSKKTSVFVFSDNDIVEESFLEDVNNILSSGLVPGIFNGEELQKIREDIRKDFKAAGNTIETNDAMHEFFFNRIKDNLHVSICMSPIGATFRNYCRMYPALINNTTIDWFMRWPEDALVEVAQKFITDIEVPEENKAALARICSYSHQTAIDNASQMLEELKRVLYVTPTNYIELLKGYKKILDEKRHEVGSQINKLRNGLSKLEDARKQVVEMAQDSDIKRAEVTKQNKICEELMIEVAKETKVADERSKHISAEQEKISKEKEETEKMAADAESELKKAEPALLAAQDAIEGLDKKYIAEVKSFPSPPEDVAMVMSAVMLLLNREPTWQTVKKELADPTFIKKIKEYDKDKIPQKVLKSIEKYTKKEEFEPGYVATKSAAAGALCMWVRSVEDYAKALKVVEPKRQKKMYAEELLRKKIEYLNQLESDFKVLTDKIAELQGTLDKTTNDMQKYKIELEDLQTKIDRGDKLVAGLASEKIRWEASLIELDMQYEKLTGDCMLTAAFMSYAGPFPSEYRDQMITVWVNMVQSEKVPYTQGYDFTDFLAGQALVREWNIKGLPTDKFSTENGVMVTMGQRWPLLIDPQTQAYNWIRNMEDKHLKIADLKDKDYMKAIEYCIQHGKPCLMPDIGEELDPSLDSVLMKSTTKVMGKKQIKIGDRELEYNDNFKLYITTRMQNPHYTPEISTKVIVINFTVKQTGLEEQLLAIVVQKEQANLEKSKNEVVMKIAKNKKVLIDLEDRILRMLQESKTSLLEDVELISTLQTSKDASDEVKQALEQSESAMKRIDDTRETYRPCGKEASILFFVLNDLAKIDPMYQFSLDWYKELFKTSIDKSKDNMFNDRIKNIMKEHTLAVYRQACRSLFERHKLLLSLQMTVKLKIAQGEIDEEEWAFFLKGGQVLDRTEQAPKPQFDWISMQSWDHLTDLERTLPEIFTGLPAAISHNQKEWFRWYCNEKPENATLPGEWETKCEDRLKKMIILRSLRQDRVIFAAQKFVEEKMKKEFIETRPTKITEIYAESKCSIPIIFVLSPGVDPTELLMNFASSSNRKVETISLGKGQSDKAKKLMTEGAEKGNWVFLANCHLSVSLLPELEGVIDQVLKGNVDEDFRIFLSSNPHEKFPISLLQRSIKMTSEPPLGIKANMMRMYTNMGEFQEVNQDKSFRKAVFGLCWFHSILIERKKFKTLGWNVTYAFNDSDFSVCEDLIATYMGKINMSRAAAEVPMDKKINWQAIQYLIADANYGGRVTDDYDRKLIKVYAKEVFQEVLITSEKWKPIGCEDLKYQYPDESASKVPADAAHSTFTPQYFINHIMDTFDANDHPMAFGQHINAQITSQIIDATTLLDDILSLQAQKTASGGDSVEDQLLKLCADLKENIPEVIDIYEVKHKFRNDDSPLKVVLLQEISRYNVLLKKLKLSLDQLVDGIKGNSVISPDLELIMNSLADNKIPVAWSFMFFSLKPLSNWIMDLNQRYSFFRDWAFKQIPPVFWISCFTYPTGFTTALLQRFSRKPNGAPIDKLEFEFIPMTQQAKAILEGAKDGAYLHGFYLEGAKWNMEKHHLQDAEQMELFSTMPVIHFKPITKRVKPPQNVYECPTYYYPIRKGTVERDSFMFKVDLKSGDHPAEYWIKRGTALLLSLSN